MRLNKKFFQKLSFYLKNQNILSDITNDNELMNFFKELYPIKIDKELIRIGSKDDGGYIVPDDLDDIEALFSPGVGFNQDFDFECAKRGMRVFMADASVDGPVNIHKNFNFTKKFIGSFDNENLMSIDSWIEDSMVDQNSDLLLQMDIEGYEYETIYSISEAKIKRFRIMLIEFHQLDHLFNKFVFEKFQNVFYKILQTHYVVHIHPNNCSKPVVKGDISIPPVMEFTFIKKDRVSNLGYVTEFPNKLDIDCTKKETIVLPECWYKSN